VRVLLLNAGSSSLKCSLLESSGRAVLARSTTDWAGSVTRYERVGAGRDSVKTTVEFRGNGDAVRHAFDDMRLDAADARPSAVGHRFVHGGDFNAPVRITPKIRARIADLSELAPLHNPPGLETLDAAESLFSNVPHIAVFDTAFHATLPAEAYTYAVPHVWTHRWGVRRYGFHGLNHSYCARRAAEMLHRSSRGLRLIVCHLGHGCSACAVLDGRSLDTTMGFTPLDGLVMATRSGSVDPGILLHVQQKYGLTATEVESQLNHDAGLLGVSGVSGDMREVLAASKASDPGARLAVDTYAYRVRQAIGALSATLGGVDALIFSAGVGENSPEIRAATCRGLQYLGIELDERANAQCRPDTDIARADARARILVIAAREDLAMLAGVEQIVTGTRGPELTIRS